MPTSPSERDTRERFEAQFTPVGAAFEYRRQETGPAYRVSRDERDAFVARFDRQYARLLAWIFGAASLTIIMLLMTIRRISQGLGGVSYGTLWFSAAAALLVAFFVLFYRIDTAPQRALATKMPVARALSRKQRRRIRLEQTSWWQMTGPLLLMAVNAGRIVGQATRNTADKIYLVFFIAVAAMLVWQCIQKWRVARSG